jgi:SAM-dependent methyltransferase
MSASTARWHRYWSELDDALHRHSSPEWRRFYAQELLVHLPVHLGRVLELGCGNGDLYPLIRPATSEYIGIDFSPTMLQAFRKRETVAPLLVCADASALPIGPGRFDVVFSNGMAQYLDVAALNANLRQVASLLAPSGVYLIGNVPDAQLRWLHYRGALGPAAEPTLRGWLRAAAFRLGLKRDDGIGYWYSRRRLAKMAARHGLVCRAVSSESYEYRFHAVLNLAPSHPS